VDASPTLGQGAQTKVCATKTVVIPQRVRKPTLSLAAARLGLLKVIESSVVTPTTCPLRAWNFIGHSFAPYSRCCLSRGSQCGCRDARRECRTL